MIFRIIAEMRLRSMSAGSEPSHSSGVENFLLSRAIPNNAAAASISISRVKPLPFLLLRLPIKQPTDTMDT